MTAATKQKPTVRERPILFSAPMVRAILEGKKTQTRRVVKGPANALPRDVQHLACPHGGPGDQLWVRETWGALIDPGTARTVKGGVSRTDHITYRVDGEMMADGFPWRPSIHMPRWASRISLPLTSVRVERLQDISEEDAKAEGAYQFIHSREGQANSNDMDAWAHWTRRLDRTARVATIRGAFAAMWSSINGPYNWGDNPWVWVLGWDKAEVRT